MMKIKLTPSRIVTIILVVLLLFVGWYQMWGKDRLYRGSALMLVQKRTLHETLQPGATHSNMLAPNKPFVHKKTTESAPPPSATPGLNWGNVKDFESITTKETRCDDSEYMYAGTNGNVYVSVCKTAEGKYTFRAVIDGDDLELFADKDGTNEYFIDSYPEFIYVKWSLIKIEHEDHEDKEGITYIPMKQWLSADPVY